MDDKGMLEPVCEIIQEAWYEQLIWDCKQIITEAVFDSRWVLIEGYWHLGQRILKDTDRVPSKELVSRVSQSLGRGKRQIYRAIQFAEKFPTYESLRELREITNITWHKICNNILPAESGEYKEYLPLPEGVYEVIYADPPWPYPERLDPKNLYGNISYHYDSMKISELCNLPINALAAENSVLFLWVAAFFLDDSVEVINAWGFEYKSNYVWVKQKKRAVLGFYASSEHELLLVATKGSFLPETKKLPSSVVTAPISQHSAKPPEFYDLIEYLYPNRRYLELFLRGKPHSDKWVGWGDEAFDS